MANFMTRTSHHQKTSHKNTKTSQPEGPQEPGYGEEPTIECWYFLENLNPTARLLSRGKSKMISWKRRIKENQNSIIGKGD